MDPSGVKRTIIRVIGVIFSYFLIKGKEFYFVLAGNSRYPSSSKPSKNDWRVGDEIRGKKDLVRISREFEQDSTPSVV